MKLIDKSFNIVRFVIKCSFIVRIFCIVGVDIFKNKFGQILQSIYIRGGAGRAVEDNVSRVSVFTTEWGTHS